MAFPGGGNATDTGVKRVATAEVATIQASQNSCANCVQIGGARTNSTRNTNKEIEPEGSPARILSSSFHS